MAIEQEKQRVTTIQQRCTWWTSLGGPVCRFGDVVQTCIALVDYVDYVDCRMVYIDQTDVYDITNASRFFTRSGND